MEAGPDSYFIKANRFKAQWPLYQAAASPNGSFIKAGARAAAPSARPPGCDGDLSLLRSHCCRLLYGLCCATLHLLRALPRLVQEALYVVGSADDLRRWLRLRPWAGQYIHADVLGCVLGELGAEGLHRRKPCCSCAHEVRCRLRSVGRAAQTARDGGRALSVVRQRVGLGVSCKVVLAEAGPASIEDRGRPAVDKLLVRRNSGLGLRVGPSGWSWP